MSIFSSSVVTSELQAFVNQCIGCSLEIFYVYSCIWCISRCCIQLSQECIACGGTRFIDSRAHIVDNHVTASNIAITIHEGSNNIGFINIITRCTIKVCCECAVWAFNYFCAVSFCVNNWGYSINCICFLTSCCIRAFRYVNVVTSFYDSAKASDNILTSIIDVGKILFSDACDNSFTSNIMIIPINVLHGHLTIAIYRIGTWFDMTFSNFYFMQLGPINSIRRCSTYITSLNVHNFVAAVIEARLSQANVSCCTTSRRCNCYTTVIYFSVTCCYRTIFCQIKVILQGELNISTICIISLFYSKVLTCHHINGVCIFNCLSRFIGIACGIPCRLKIPRRGRSTCRRNFIYSFTSTICFLFNSNVALPLNHVLVIKFNIYVSIFTICIIFRYSRNSITIAFNVQLTIVGKEIGCNFFAINCSCIRISTNTYTNVFQLRHVYSISIFITSCYIDDLTFLIVITNRNGTNLCTSVPLIIC